MDNALLKSVVKYVNCCCKDTEISRDSVATHLRCGLDILLRHTDPNLRTKCSELVVDCIRVIDWTDIGSRIQVSSQLFRSSIHWPSRGKFFRKLLQPCTRHNYQAEASPMVRDDDDVTPALQWRRGEGVRSHWPKSYSQCYIDIDFVRKISVEDAILSLGIWPNLWRQLLRVARGAATWVKYSI